MDSAVYTKPHHGTEYGAFELPREVYWRLLPRYVQAPSQYSNEQFVDERIMLVLQDEANSFWPVITRMSLEEAERLHAELARMIAEKKSQS